MRSISKTMLRTCAGLAVAAGLVAGGAGVASAATTSPTTTPSNHHPACNPWARERWNLNGSNKVNVPWNGQTLTYTVTFRQFGSCLSGTLTDPYYNPPTGATGPIWGTINGNRVAFSFTYPSGSSQGTRYYSGTVNRWGYVSGNWRDAGTDQSSGTFSLAKHAARACPWWWSPHAACLVFPHH